MINRAQLKWHSYSGQKPAKSRNTPSLSLPSGTVTKEMIQISIFAYLFGMASINGLYPFALSFMAANFLYRRDYILPGVFSFLGIFMTMKSFVSLRYLGAMGIFLIIHTLLNKINRQNEFLLGVTVFFSNMFAGFIFLMTRGLSPYDIFLLVAESGMACIMTFVIPGGMPWIFKEPIQTTERNICMAVIAGVILSIARNFIWLGINVRDVLGAFAVLSLALVDGPGAGAATGIIIGITGFSFSLSPWSTAIMAFSGLVSGSFNKLGKIGVITGFSMGYLLYNFYVNSMGEALLSPSVLALAYILFLLLPQKTIQNMQLYLSSSYDDNKSENHNLEERARDRLYELASLLNDLGGAFKETLIKKEERVLPAEYLDSVCREVQLSICSGCGLRRICWEKELKRTMGAFYTLIKHHEGLYDKNEIPFLFKSRCSQTENIKKIVKEKSDVFKIKQQMASIIKCNQELIRGHFTKTADMVKALAEGVWEENYERNIEGELSERLSQLGVKTERINSDYNNRKFNINVVKSSCVNDKQCEMLIPMAASDVLGRKVSTKVIDCPLKSGSSKCRLKITSEGTLEVSVGAAGVAKEGQNVSGDGFSFMEFKEGRFLLALCDGMGVGKNAAEHSEKTLALLERLLEAGYNQDTALKVANSAMIATNADEGFSTMDITLIDTANGKVKFIKAGAPVGFLKRGMKIEVIKGGSLPVGIMDNILPKITEKTVRCGDMVIMVTDGIIDAFSKGQNGEEMLRRFLIQTKTANPQEMAERILDKAKQKNSIRDDMTVLAASIWEKR